MSVVVVTGSAGLVGSEAARFFAGLGYQIVGIDNDMRQHFFGREASTVWNRRLLEEKLPNYTHFDVDIRAEDAVAQIFSEYEQDIKLVIHAAGQPSHDWAANHPFTDFTVNANGTLILLEMTRRHCPDASFIFLSTNKLYGDTPNDLPLVEQESRWEVDPSHPFAAHGIDETMRIDRTRHSLFGASKVAADILVQEYGRYFGLKTVCFRGGCFTGGNHSGAKLHGFLAYLMKCAITGEPYTILGYKGKQVRDNIHSYDLVNAFYHFFQNPGVGEVYNMGGSRFANCSLLEAVALCQEITGNKMNLTHSDEHRIGDHIWWISDVRKFQQHYPDWRYKYNIQDTLVDIYQGLLNRV